MPNAGRVVSLTAEIWGVACAGQGAGVSSPETDLFDTNSMRRSIKGALLSGLVFPGLGQAVLRHYGRAAALMATVSIAIAVIVVKAVQEGLAVMSEIDLESGGVDLDTVSNAVDKASATFSGTLYNSLILLILVCWVVGIVDAYSVGRRLDAAERLPPPS